MFSLAFVWRGRYSARRTEAPDLPGLQHTPTPRKKEIEIQWQQNR
jgi:hypothetical protein